MPARPRLRITLDEICAAPAAVVVYVECPISGQAVALPLGVWPEQMDTIILILAVN